MSPDSIERIYKLCAGFKTDISNYRFTVDLSIDELTKYDLKSKDLVIDGYSTWERSRYRNDVRNIIFDPKYFYDCKPTKNVYNLFNGLNVERDSLVNVEPLEETAPFFQHILKIWWLILIKLLGK